MPRQDDSRQNQPTAPVSRRDALRSIPAIMPGVTYRDDDDGHVLVQVPVPPRRGFLGFFQTAASTRKVRLDSIGAFVIKQIDGRRCVADIVDAFASQYRSNRREAELCIADFLKSLTQRNIIVIGVR
ncbi:MAG: PqqD family protein [Lentisphaerae bacterium]|nr:PqqD family protein [Lentisphaeria bacterium]NLE56094.1 PqqD family protein [Lentisphaerota bacterium]